MKLNIFTNLEDVEIVCSITDILHIYSLLDK
jgi:hypothetical protein